MGKVNIVFGPATSRGEVGVVFPIRVLIARSDRVWVDKVRGGS